MKIRSRAHGTGSHVFLNGKPLTSVKKGSWAQGEGKPLEKRGRKVQSPKSNWGSGGSPLSKNNTKKNNYFLFVIHIFFHNNNNKFLFDMSVPIVFTGIHKGR